METQRFVCHAKAGSSGGFKNAKPHPFNAEFDDKGRAHQGNSHQETCPQHQQLPAETLEDFQGTG